MQSLWTSRSANRKTGDIPQQFIGSTREESKASCTGCPLLADRTCYSHFGTEAWGHTTMIKASSRGKDYSLETALAQRAVSAKYVRMGAIGDPASTPVKTITRKVRKLGLGVLCYTHFWATRGKGLKGLAMASCDTWAQVKTAVRSGWRAAIHVEPAWLETHGTHGKLDGIRFTQCPNQTHGVQCNECGLCDAARPVVDVIVFQNH